MPKVSVRLRIIGVQNQNSTNMKTIILRSLAIAAFALIAGCGDKQSESPKSVNEEKKSCLDVSESLEKEVRSLTADLKDEGDDEPSALAQYTIGGGLKSGEYNVAIKHDANSTKFFLIQAVSDGGSGLKTEKVDEIDLRTKSAQLWVGDRNGLKYSEKNQTGWAGGDSETIALTDDFDGKMLLKAPVTKDLAWIGVEDARDSGITGKRSSMFVALEYHSLNRKRMRVWAENQGGTWVLQVHTNKETRPVPNNFDICDLGYEKWGMFDLKLSDYGCR